MIIIIYAFIDNCGFDFNFYYIIVQMEFYLL